MKDIHDIRDAVKARLKPARYLHTLGVVKFAVKLAKIHNVDVKQAEVAALLHDYCKYESDETIIKTLETIESLHPVIKSTPNLGHGLMASLIVEKLFSFNDKVITDAIKHHTFGNRVMSSLDKIIYLADSLEENRQYDGVELFRATALVDLDEALLMVSQNTLIFELTRGHMVHENTVLMRNGLLEEK